MEINSGKLLEINGSRCVLWARQNLREHFSPLTWLFVFHVQEEGSTDDDSCEGGPPHQQEHDDQAHQGSQQAQPFVEETV